MIKFLLKNKKGITLISLVVTIVIIVILAAVAINVAIGDNGLFTKAKLAKNDYTNAIEKEKQSLEDMYGEILVATDGTITLTAESLNQIIDNKISDALNSVDTTPAGTIISYGGTNAPEGYLKCEGQAVSRTEYSKLFDAIGTIYGSGDGNTTFNVPDLRGEFLRGTGTNSHANNGNGAAVGIHQDATAIPDVYVVYNSSVDKHVIGIGYDPENPTSGVAAFNMDFQYKRSSLRKYTAVNYSNVASGTSASIYRYQYSPRPTNTSVLYCIKAK